MADPEFQSMLRDYMEEMQDPRLRAVSGEQRCTDCADSTDHSWYMTFTHGQTQNRFALGFGQIFTFTAGSRSVLSDVATRRVKSLCTDRCRALYAAMT